MLMGSDVYLLTCNQGYTHKQEGRECCPICLVSDKSYFIVLFCCFRIYHSTSILEIAKSNLFFLHIQFR